MDELQVIVTKKCMGCVVFDVIHSEFVTAFSFSRISIEFFCFHVHYFHRYSVTFFFALYFFVYVIRTEVLYHKFYSLGFII